MDAVEGRFALASSLITNQTDMIIILSNGQMGWRWGKLGDPNTFQNMTEHYRLHPDPGFGCYSYPSLMRADVSPVLLKWDKGGIQCPANPSS